MSQTVTIEEGRAYVFVAVDTRTVKSSAFTPRVQPIASRRWSRSGRGCIGASAPSRRRGACGLKLASRSCSNYMSGDFQSEIVPPGHRSFAILRARTRGQWRRRALHPNLEGELALGADVQNHRGTARRACRIRQALNETGRRAAWIQNAREGQRGANHATNCD